ncbi:MAG TPA: DNA polymerase IV [Bacteroidetes bacterium]|nr:DNA polymerase IV [Bacteroidota bacterium]
MESNKRSHETKRGRLEQGRQIVHLDLDSFFVSVERLRDSRLQGKPVIVGGMSERGVVASCSYEARHYGVHSAMPVRMARQLCPEAVVVRGDMELYSHYSHMVTEIIAEEAPVYEKSSIDEHYLDVTGMDRFFGTLKWSRELKKRIVRETGLPISFGLSVNKTVSKIATGEAKPNGELMIPAGGVTPFLAPLSIRKIPMIGNKTYRLLRSMGISTIGTLQQIPPEMLEKVLGKNGLTLWKKARGIDNSPVMDEYRKKSVGTERTFDRDATDARFLVQVLAGMVEKTAWELRKQGKMTSCVTVKIRYSDFKTYTLQKRIPYTSFDHILLDTAKELFHKLYRRRILVRLIGVRFTHLVQGVPQLNLFEDTSEMIRLYLAIDRIRKKYGFKAVGKTMGRMN